MFYVKGNNYIFMKSLLDCIWNYDTYRVCQKKKDILNIHIKSEEINIFSQKFG